MNPNPESKNQSIYTASSTAFKILNNLEDLCEFPVILKTAEQAYDGKGQFF